MQSHSIRDRLTGRDGLTGRRRWQALAVFTLAALLAGLVGCKSPAARKRVLTKDQERQIAENVLKEAPKTQHPLDINFDNKITLLGYDIQGEVKAGASFDLTMFFRVDQPVHGDWKVFVHFEAPGKRRQPFDHYGVGGLYPVSQWKKGEIVRDKVTVAVPGNWPAGKTQIIVGFFDWGAWSKANQNRRLPLHAKSKVKGTPDDRVVIATLDVLGGVPGGAADPAAAAPRPGPAPSYTATRAEAAPAIDGKLDDPAWASARPTAAFKQPDGRRLSMTYETTAKLLWDDANLYVACTTKDDDIANKFTANDTTLWEGDVFEVFLKPDTEGGAYYELQWAPNNARFDAKFTGHRAPAWEEAAKFDSGARHAVSVSGSVNAAGEPDTGWTVEAAIPWSAFGLEKAPAVGTKWKMNMYRIDSKGTHNMAFMGAWAPVGGDFHNLDGAGTLELR